MSYWDELEPVRGNYKFNDLDEQISLIERSGGHISLCLGARQPRWPENHWPNWAWELSKEERSQALLKFIELVVKRYKSRDCIISYQLENEALLKSFGLRTEVSRPRIRSEFKLIKGLDAARPIIMSTSNSWGIPLRKPIPDIVGFSYYHTVFNTARHIYTSAYHKPWILSLRGRIIKLLWRRPSFIHELQLEPWGPKSIWQMSLKQQGESMDVQKIKDSFTLAMNSSLGPIDLWGAEWWYWRYKKHKDTSIINAVMESIKLTNKV